MSGGMWASQLPTPGIQPLTTARSPAPSLGFSTCSLPSESIMETKESFRVPEILLLMETLPSSIVLQT